MVIFLFIIFNFNTKLCIFDFRRSLNLWFFSGKIVIDHSFKEFTFVTAFKHFN
jgi:hypothetical protein